MFVVRVFYGVILLVGVSALTCALLYGLFVLSTMMSQNMLGSLIAAPVVMFFAYLVGEGAAEFAKERGRYKVK